MLKFTIQICSATETQARKDGVAEGVIAKMRIQFIRLDEIGHRSTKRKLYRAERQSLGIAHLAPAHTERLIVQRAGVVWEKLITIGRASCRERVWQFV